VRHCADTISSMKLAPVGKFIKDVNFLKGKFVGKKPVPGIFTDEELTVLQQDWSARNSRISEVYSSLTDQSWEAIHKVSLSTMLKSLLTSASPLAKQIEECAQKRIPLLLTSSRVRGKKEGQTITKGSTLMEKVRNLNPDNVRIPARLLWSPVQGLPITEWTDLILKCVHQASLKKGDYLSFLENYVKRSEEAREPYARERRLAIAGISSAISLYLELVLDKRGIPAWDALLCI